jgi:DNA-binding XRE family transcriptional regulator
VRPFFTLFSSSHNQVYPVQIFSVLADYSLSNLLTIQCNLEIGMKKKGELRPAIAFGRVIRELRNQHNISQEKLALISDMDRTFISLLERGLRQPSLKSILRLSESLNIRPGDLVERVVEKLGQKDKSKL